MGMERGTLACALGILGMDVAAGAEEVEATPSLVGSGRNPGGGMTPWLKRETPVNLLAKAEALGVLPKTGRGLTGCVVKG